MTQGSKLRAETCSLVRGFKKPGITFNELKSLALLTLSDKNIREGLVAKI